MKLLQKIFTPRPFIPYQIFKENGLRELVENFYSVMETDPQAKDCLDVHELVDGKVEDHVKEKLFDFLSGWMGGPQLFMKKHGHPRMRARHMHVKISEKEKEQWLYCMEKALSKSSVKIKKKHKKIMYDSFTALAMRIQNT